MQEQFLNSLVKLEHDLVDVAAPSNNKESNLSNAIEFCVSKFEPSKLNDFQYVLEAI